MSALPGITRFALAIALLTCSLPWVAASRAQALEPGAATDNSLVLLMDQAPLDEVVKAIAQRTGNHYVFESPLPGRVTLAIPSRVSAAEATEILNAALLLKGMLAIPIEPGKYKIERWEKMAGSAPYTEASLSKGAEGAVTTRLVLRHADPQLVAAGQLKFDGVHSDNLFLSPDRCISRIVQILQLVNAADHSEQQPQADDRHCAGVAGQDDKPRRRHTVPNLFQRSPGRQRCRWEWVLIRRQRVVRQRRPLAMRQRRLGQKLRGVHGGGSRACSVFMDSRVKPANTRSLPWPGLTRPSMNTVLGMDTRYRRSSGTDPIIRLPNTP